MQKQSLYKFHDQFIFRTHLFPLQHGKMDEEFLFEFSQQLVFKEAIYLASPILYNELIKWHNKELKDKIQVDKLVSSILKYCIRMQSRCTPFGLFASCGTGKWGDQSKIIISDSLNRHTRLNMNFLCILSQHLSTDPSIIPLLKFYPNNSNYVIGKQLRYVEYKYLNNNRIHQITGVNYSECLQTILQLAQKGALINNLANALVDSEITYNDGDEFVKELIANQILISELEPAVTGHEFLHQIVFTLKKLNISNCEEINSIIQLLENIQQLINEIDIEKVNDIEKYKTIYNKLKILNIPIQKENLIQTDSYRITELSGLDIKIQKQIIEAIIFLNSLSPSNEVENLRIFKENFRARYEDAEISLLEALDTETGIGYTGNDKIGINQLIDDLFINKQNQSSLNIQWDKSQKVLHRYLLQALKENLFSFKFTPEDIKEFTSFSDNLPDTLPVKFRLINDNKIYLEGFSNSSAANLLGRFASGDESIHNIVKDIVKHENTIDKDKLLAEIIHFPNGFVGNIIQRPVLRNYEMPYLGKSSLPPENQILLQDLLVSIKNDKVILYSKRLDKEIIPRLSTAHNYYKDSLPVYKFLCDLQTQYYDKSTLSFSWGVLENSYKFLPRAEYQDVILQRARWTLSKDDFTLFFEKKELPSKQKINEWLKFWKMPSMIVLVEGDNELLINFDDDLSVKVFSNLIRKKSIIVIQEFLFDNSNLLIKDKNGKGYTNELIAILLKNKEQNLSSLNIKPALFHKKNNLSIQRNFSIGSDWLYYKFYCGLKTADKLLVEIIKPLTEEILQNKWSDKFFFLRYGDPEWHIRLRIHTTNIDFIGNIIHAVNRYTNSYVVDGFINKIQIDTYKRELERYGTNSIEVTESYFYIDSIATLMVLNLSDKKSDEQIRLYYALRSIDDLLSIFNYCSNDKLLILEQLKIGFFNEHGGGISLKVQLDAKYRNLRNFIDETFNDNLEARTDKLPFLHILDWKKEQLMFLSSYILQLKKGLQLEVELNNLLRSYIHLMINRLFKAKARTHELVIYDLLYRYYKSSIIRNKKKSIPNTINKN